MAGGYRAVGWNRQKRVYDAVVAAGIVLFLAVFIGVGAALFPDATAETLLIRGLGITALLLLHAALIVGPLVRLRPGLLPLLYNRRHLGVMMFTVGLAHGVISLVQYHVLGSVGPLTSLLTGGGGPPGPGVPFQLFGLLGLLWLFLMASTSHDFWLNVLTPRVWKRIHMGVYGVYLLIVAHVAFGIIHQETHPAWVIVLGIGILAVGALHVIAGRREARLDLELPAQGDFVRVCRADDMEDGRARSAVIAGDRVAVYRVGNRITAVSGTCRHQGGPLAEGRIINGCIVCPWHGYEYDPFTGRAPAPFTEKICTFDVRIEEGEVLVSTTPNAPGTPSMPASL